MSLQKTWGNIHLTALGAMMLSFLLVGCDDSVAQNAAPPAPTVSAAKVLVKSISQWDSFNGRIEAVESVQLRPRVSGYIDKVNYTDGQEVKKGQVLFTIDDRTYRAALEQAQAALAQAKLDLHDTVLTAPSDGTLMTRAVEPGTMLNAGGTVLTLSLTHPVWVRAYVDEKNLGQAQPGREVLLYTDSRPDKPYHGKIGFVSPSAEFTPKTVETPDLRTDLVYRLRIVVTDADDALRQGMPVTVQFGDEAGHE